MTLDVGGVFADAWRMWKSDRDLLLSVGGFFMFLPQFSALLLMVPPPDFPGFDAPEAKMQLYTVASQTWMYSYGLGELAVLVATALGPLTILVLYLDARRPALRQGLMIALRLLLRAFAVSLLVSLPLLPALYLTPLFLVPMLFLEGRLLLALPALVAEQPLSVIGTIRRTWHLTRNHSLILGGLACITLFGGLILAAPFSLIGASLDGAPMANPFVAALLDAGAAAGVTFGGIAAILIHVALYRRLAPSNGI